MQGCEMDMSSKRDLEDAQCTNTSGGKMHLRSPSRGSQTRMDADKLSQACDSKVPISEGSLVSLKTILETKARDRTVEVYVTVVEPKQASSTLSLIRTLVPDDGGLDLQHLRRFAKYRDVPLNVQASFNAEKLKSAVLSSDDSIDDEIQKMTTLVGASEKLFLVAGSVNTISRNVLFDALSATVSNVILFITSVPLLAPTSQEQASRWTSQYWPTVYKKSNPFGPHPSIVSRAEEDIRGDVKQWLKLADEIGKQSKDSGIGEGFGVVIVERTAGIARPVAVAGDARWLNWPQNGAGNVTAHAALRAIAMVACGLKISDEPNKDPLQESPFESAHIKETPEMGRTQADGASVLKNDYKEEADQPHSLTTAVSESVNTTSQCKNAVAVAVHPHPSAIPTNSNQGTGEGTLDSGRSYEEKSNVQASSAPKLEIFQDSPLFEIEAENSRQSGNGDGYLCHGLEIYCSHEPCVMCSMAIVHSRFGKVVFARRMQQTGGLCADGDLGHGLFWRKELNWTMLGWQWFDSICSTEEKTIMQLHA